MIEKIPKQNTWGQCLDKINELVDAVNSIVSVQEKLIDSRFVVETKHEEPADPYAEQRKWIGKLCWFWDEDRKDAFYDVLRYVDENSKCPYINIGCYAGYKHCEPVKPDDDIIYKREQ
jgi:hypothetical protein